MADTPRYSREDYADAVAQATEIAGPLTGGTTAVSVNRLKVWAAMLSEAANRAPTHAELVAAIPNPRCPEHDIICRWGCEMECFLADCSEDEVQAAVRDNR